jgi:hypothetical protein
MTTHRREQVAALLPVLVATANCCEGQGLNPDLVGT